MLVDDKTIFCVGNIGYGGHAGAGTTLRPVLVDPNATIKDAASTLLTRGAKLHAQSIRTPRWRFTHWSDGRTEPFDHDIDSEELHEVSAQHADVVAELTSQIQNYLHSRRLNKMRAEDRNTSFPAKVLPASREYKVHQSPASNCPP